MLKVRTLIALLLCLGIVDLKTAEAQIWQLPHDGQPGDHFGASVAIDGERVLIGASGEATCGPNAGAAYIFERAASGGFEVVARLVPDDCVPGRFFGRTVALSGDTAVIAAGGEGGGIGETNAAHIFTRTADGRWIESSVLREPAALDRAGSFASDLALQGDRLVITSAGDTSQRRYHGAAYVYRLVSGDEPRSILEAVLQPAEDTREGVFGTSASLDGDRLLITASPYDFSSTGSLYLFARNGDGEWIRTDHLTGFHGFRLKAALAGAILIVGEPQAGPSGTGRVTVMGRTSSGNWLRQSTLTARVPYTEGAFGSLTAMTRTSSGLRVLGVGYSEQLGRETGIDRVVQVFAYDATAGWTRRQVLDLGHPGFAMALAVDAEYAVVSLTGDYLPGSVFVVRLL